jgi:protoporphyrinogen oxidase
MKKRVAVLGAGPMGLAVAYQLALDGYEPMVYEADDRIGGMAAHFDFDGLSIERYYHFHCTSDVAFINILEELGLSDQLHWKPAKMGYWYHDLLQDWGNPIALFKFKGPSLIAKLRYGLHVFFSTRRNNWHPLDSQNAVAWVRRWVGSEAYEVFWRRLFEYKFYEFTNNLSAAWIWSRVRRIGRSRYNLFQEKLGYLDGGSTTLLAAMQKEIEKRGGKIMLKSPVQKVVIEDQAVVGIQINDHLEPYDQVISTIPIPYVPKIIPDLPAEIKEQFLSKKNIAVVCVIVKLKKPLTQYFWLNTNDLEMDIPGLIEYTNLRELDQSIVYVPFYIPGNHPTYAETDDQFKQKVISYLKKINTSLEDKDVIKIYVSRYRFAQPICEPNFLESLPPVKTPIAGLLVADTSYYYPEDRGISESISFGRKMAKDMQLLNETRKSSINS